MDSIDGLRTFVSVIDAGSFTAGADRLGISKKLASKYVGELESRLGVKLLQRTTRSLSLTSAGQRYYPRCVALLDEFDEMSADIRDADSGVGGTLRIAAPVTFGEVFLQGCLADFRDQHPDLTIDLRLNDRFVDLVGEGFDLAIRIGKLEDSGLTARKLGEIELIAVASPDYLREARPLQTPADLRSHPCIRDSNFRGGQLWPFEIAGSRQSIAVTGPFMVNSASGVRHLALRGSGVALCPDFAVAEDVAAGNLVRVLSDFPSGQLDIHAVLPDTRRMPARTRAALDFFVQALKVRPWAMEKV